MNSAIISLMRRSNLSRNTRLHKEQRLCVEFADLLRYYTLDGTLKTIWLHIPNESKRSIIVALLLRAMGMITGAADYVFCWHNGSGFIEFKVGTNKQTESQKEFQVWCDSLGVKYAVSYSVDDGIDILRKWGVLENKEIEG